MKTILNTKERASEITQKKKTPDNFLI